MALLWNHLRNFRIKLNEITARILRQNYPPLELAISGTGQPLSNNLGHEQVEDVFSWNGILNAGLGACPKHQLSLNRRRKKKYNINRMKPYVDSWHMYVKCDGCGDYYKKYHLCGTCYDQTRYETQLVKEHLKNTGQTLSEESVIRYQNDEVNKLIEDGTTQSTPRKDILMSDRKRPSGWFNSQNWTR